MIRVSPVLVILASALVSIFLLRSLLPLLRSRLLDFPNPRSSHIQPTPRGGGLAFVLVSAVASALSLITASSPRVAFSSLPLLVLPLALVGFLDDRHNLRSSIRYGAQVFTALLLLLISPLTRSLFGVVPALQLGSLLVWPCLLLILIAVTAVINFTNFMDGLDGLVAGCMAISISSAGYQLDSPWCIWAVVGALIGFLGWNWSPARVFMGDVGSTFLGAIFAGLVLQASSWSSALSLLLVATPLLGDACICVPRRLFAGQSVFQAHRLHLFQRLHLAGWPHARVSLLYIGFTAALALVQLLATWQFMVFTAVLVLCIGFFFDQRIAVPFSIASRA